MKMTKDELNKVLANHLLWLKGDSGEGANLMWADLRETNLTRADLRGADLDYSCWGLSCKTKNVKVDKRIAAQLAAHFCVLDCDDPGYQAAREAILGFARTSHRAGDLGLTEEVKG